MGIVSLLNGRLTRALAKVWPPTHLGPDDVHEIIEVAAALREKSQPLDRREVQLLDLADRLQLMSRAAPKPPRPPSPFDERIRATEVQLAEVTAELDSSRGELVEASTAALDAGTRLSRALGRKDATGIADAEAALYVAIDRRAQAEHEFHMVDARWLRVRARMTSLEMVRSRWHAEETSMVRGPNGEIMSLAEFGKTVPRGSTGSSSHILHELGRQAAVRSQR